MKNLITAALLLGSLNCFAQSVGPQDVEPMLQQMQASGQITAEQAALTKKYAQSLNKQGWKDIESKAKDCIKRNPAAMEQLKEDGVEAVTLDLCK
ncbi:MAG: hypothetical protein K2P81_09500 [Bacteriovoracaceae bacterium]|nr:hypothetical protein [Bacteriovoracaceae bacterium]